MQNYLKLILSLTYLILAFSCQQAVQGSDNTKPGVDVGPVTPNNNAQGTVDGGGGNSVTNPKNGERVLLDLAENIDKEPFEFDIRDKILEVSKDQAANLKSAAFQKWAHYQNFHAIDYMKNLFGGDEEFFIWALGISLQTNQEIASGYYSQSVYDTHLSAYDLKENRVVTNVRYALTDNELNDVGDAGVMKISNPESKKQLAVQDSNGFVLINKSEFEKLDSNSKIALKLHESLLYLMLKFNPKLIKEKGTAPIRQFVQDLFNYAFLSENKNDRLIPPEKVKSSYQALNFPKIKPNYSMIGKISDASTDQSLICKLEQVGYIDPTTGRKEFSANYVFTKDGHEITNAYSMDIDFYMKYQMYLTANGICIFKPSPCQMKLVKLPWDKDYAYRYFIGEMSLPDKSNDVIYLTSRLLNKYQTARICK